MYKIKQQPKDFVVEEMYKLPEPEKEKGSSNSSKYSYFIMSKEGQSTHHAVKLVARKLRIPAKWIGYAGLKDRNAITTQLISVKNKARERTEAIEAADLHGISLKLIGKGSSPVTLGLLEGNRFSITVRNLDEEELQKIESSAAQLRKNRCLFTNYFGEQRFSTNNLAVGKAMLKGDFRQAAELIAASGNNEAAAYLAEHINDYVGAIRALPKKLALLYIHAYQADVFNKTAAGYLALQSINASNELLHVQLPIIGFATELENYKAAIKEAVEQQLKEDGITLRNFVIRSIPELSCEGGERELLAEAKGFEYELADDELNMGKKKAVLSFELPKGSYATVLIKYVFD